MSSNKRNLRLAGAFATLLIFGVGVGCKGFFVNPTISTITVEPASPSVSVGGSEQLNAIGTDSQGNTYTLTAGTSCTGTTVCWSSADTSTATITAGGLLQGVAIGSATITASSGAATATASATVTLADVTGITLSANNISVPVSSTATGSECVFAYATVSGGSKPDISSTVTWVSNNTTYVTVENGEDPMCVQTGSTAGVSTTIYAQYDSNGTTITSPTVTVNVTQ